MSGTRHHTVPQFLLRGFSSHTVGKEAYAWVFRVGREPFNTNIINISVEGHFYTHEDSSVIDDCITDAEGEFASAVAKLRAEKAVGTVPTKLLATLVAHLEARTRHLRTNFEDLATTVFSRTIEFIEDHEAFKHFILQRFRREPETLIAPLRAELQARGIPELPTNAIVALLSPHLQDFVESMMPALTAQFSAAMRRIKLERPDLLRIAARNGQLRGLGQSIAPEVKVGQYESLNYVILECADRLLLGDSAVVFEISATRRFTTFLSADDELLAVYLPITPYLLLCGHIDSFTPKVGDVPAAAARCSREYFVAHENAEGFRNLQTRISELSTIIDKDQIEVLLADAFTP